MNEHGVPIVIGTLQSKTQIERIADYLEVESTWDEHLTALKVYEGLSGQINRFPAGFLRYDSSEESGYHISMVSQSLLDMLGFSSAEEFAGKFDSRYDMLVFIDDRKRALDLITSTVPHQATQYSLYRVTRADGKPLWVYDRGTLVFDKKTGITYVYVVLLDAQGFMEEQSVLRWQKTKLELLESTPGIITFDYDPKTDTFDAHFRNHQGETVHRTYRNFLESTEKPDWISRESVGELNRMRGLVLGEAITSEFEVRINVDGIEFDWYQVTCTSVTDSSGTVYRVVGRALNIERYKRQVSKWQDRARHDSLTGLANHAWLIESIRVTLNRFGSGTFIMIDIDDFKKVNDVYGHQEGDNVLRNVADVLEAAVRDTDIIGRYGGDEFAAFLPQVTDQELVRRRTEDIMGHIGQLGNDTGITITVSMGIKIVEDWQMSSEQAIKEADRAMYISKSTGKNKYTFA